LTNSIVIQPLISFTTEVGRMYLFAAEMLRIFLKKGTSFSQVVDQMYQVGVSSLGITVISGAFVGAIMAIQINLQLVDFGAQNYLGGLSTSVTIRNVGPVLIAFMLAGKVGAFTAAELGTMRVTSQMDAIRCLGADPIEYLILPRMVAVVLSSFCLLIIGLMVAIAGGAGISGWTLGISFDEYVNNIPHIVSFWSVGTGIVKSFILGLLIGVVCCYHGYHTKGGAVGVGVSVKKTAVQTLVLIILSEFCISCLSSLLYQVMHRGEL